MTLSEMLVKVAFRGNHGLNPHTVPAEHRWTLDHLVDLKLIAQDSNGNLVISTERGRYPVYNSLGHIRQKWVG